MVIGFDVFSKRKDGIDDGGDDKYFGNDGLFDLEIAIKGKEENEPN